MDLRRVDSGLRATLGGAGSAALRWAVAAIALGAVAYGWWRSSTALPEVRVARVEFGELWSSFTAEGVVRGTDYVLSAEGAGRVEAVNAREGQTVRAGDVLVRLSAIQQSGLVAEAEPAHRSALAAVEQARRERALVERRHQASLAAAEAGVRQAEAQHAQVLAGARLEEVEQARQRVARARAALLESERDFRRAETLHASGAIPRAQLERAESAFHAAQAGAGEAEAALEQVRRGPTAEQVAVSRAAVESAAAQRKLVQSESGQIAVADKALEIARDRATQALAALQRARAAVLEQRILAPAGGVVTKLYVEPGAVVVPGAPVLLVSSRDDLRIEAEISAEDSSKIQPGMAVEITAPGYPGRRFPAVARSRMPVGELKPDAAIRTRIVRTRVEVLEHANLFFPGMEVDVEAKTLLGQSVTVPSDALRFSGESPSVFLVENGRIVERKITIGTQNPERTEVLSGLLVGDRVVVDGKDQVESGVKVKVVGR